MVAHEQDDRNAQPDPGDEVRDREARDRSKGRHASSPVDSMHVESPTERDNEAGHREGKQRGD